MSQHRREKLSAFIARTKHGRAGNGSLLKLGPADPQRPFSTARHPHLTPEECQLANRLYQQAEQARPLSGDPQQVRFRQACRIGGIARAIQRRAVGNSRFGHHLMGFRGGRVMKTHGAHILQAIYPVGLLAIRMARERKRAAQYYEEHGTVLPLGAQPARSPEEARIQDLTTLWEAQCQRAQLEQQLRW